MPQPHTASVEHASATSTNLSGELHGRNHVNHASPNETKLRALRAQRLAPLNSSNTAALLKDTLKKKADLASRLAAPLEPSHLDSAANSAELCRQLYHSIYLEQEAASLKPPMEAKLAVSCAILEVVCSTLSKVEPEFSSVCSVVRDDLISAVFLEDPCIMPEAAALAQEDVVALEAVAGAYLTHTYRQQRDLLQGSQEIRPRLKHLHDQIRFWKAAYQSKVSGPPTEVDVLRSQCGAYLEQLEALHGQLEASTLRCQHLEVSKSRLREVEQSLIAEVDKNASLQLHMQGFQEMEANVISLEKALLDVKQRETVQSAGTLFLEDLSQTFIGLDEEWQKEVRNLTIRSKQDSDNIFNETLKTATTQADEWSIKAQELEKRVKDLEEELVKERDATKGLMEARDRLREEVGTAQVKYVQILGAMTDGQTWMDQSLYQKQQLEVVIAKQQLEIASLSANIQGSASDDIKAKDVGKDPKSTLLRDAKSDAKTDQADDWEAKEISASEGMVERANSYQNAVLNERIAALEKDIDDLREQIETKESECAKFRYTNLQLHDSVAELRTSLQAQERLSRQQVAKSDLECGMLNDNINELEGKLKASKQALAEAKADRVRAVERMESSVKLRDEAQSKIHALRTNNEELIADIRAKEATMAERAKSYRQGVKKYDERMKAICDNYRLELTHLRKIVEGLDGKELGIEDMDNPGWSDYHLTDPDLLEALQRTEKQLAETKQQLEMVDSENRSLAKKFTELQTQAGSGVVNAEDFQLVQSRQQLQTLWDDHTSLNKEFEQLKEELKAYPLLCDFVQKLSPDLTPKRERLPLQSTTLTQSQLNEGWQSLVDRIKALTDKTTRMELAALAENTAAEFQDPRFVQAVSSEFAKEQNHGSVSLADFSALAMPHLERIDARVTHAHVLEIFSEIDADGNRSIDKEEFGVFLSHIALQLCERVVARRIASYTTLTEEEVTKGWQALVDRVRGLEDGPVRTEVAILVEKTAAKCRDAGFISAAREKFRDLQWNESVPMSRFSALAIHCLQQLSMRVTEADVMEIFKSIDANWDGSLDAQEFQIFFSYIALRLCMDVVDAKLDDSVELVQNTKQMELLTEDNRRLRVRVQHLRTQLEMYPMLVEIIRADSGEEVTGSGSTETEALQRERKNVLISELQVKQTRMLNGSLVEANANLQQQVQVLQSPSQHAHSRMVQFENLKRHHDTEKVRDQARIKRLLASKRHLMQEVVQLQSKALRAYTQGRKSEGSQPEPETSPPSTRVSRPETPFMNGLLEGVGQFMALPIDWNGLIEIEQREAVMQLVAEKRKEFAKYTEERPTSSQRREEDGL